MTLVPAILLSASGVILAAVTFAHRDRSEWRRATPRLMLLAIGQVAFGALYASLFR
jgi:hypothetical protein